MIVNRIADMALTLGILAGFYLYQSVDFSVIFSLTSFVAAEMEVLLFLQNFSAINLCALLLFIGAMGKSAQLGLHT